MTDRERLIFLLDRYIQKTASKEEEKELYGLIAGDTSGKALGELVEGYYVNLPESFVLTEQQSASILSEVLKKRAPVVPMRAKRKQRLWIAAAVVFLLLAGGWWFFENNSGMRGNQPQLAKINDLPSPKENRAVITLADGRKIYLDSSSKGVLAAQTGTRLVKTENGELAYQATGQTAQVEYNTMFNPRGSKIIPLTLVDGTKVWLNSESSIKYPTAFIGKERRVEITGEAYFEVTHDASKPFVVGKGGTSVQVLGTHFNVNAYDDEDAIKVTLLEGSVRVQTANGKGQTAIIRPGQQARIAEDIKINGDVNLDEVMAWKNGYFSFSGADIPTVMRQLERWYDVNVVYQGKLPDKELYGKIPRDVNASTVLAALQYTGLKFTIEGNKIIVTQ